MSFGDVLTFVWAVEPNIRIEVVEGEHGRKIIQFVRGVEIVASATLEAYRTERVSAALAVSSHSENNQ